MSLERVKDGGTGRAGAAYSDGTRFAAGQSSPSAGSYVTTRFRVALVDDDVQTARCIRALIERRAGRWVLETCSKLAEATGALLTHRPDLVLLNVRIPDFPGIECLGKLTVLMPSLPVIVVSPHCDAEVILLSLTAGAVGYLVKPLRESEIVRAILNGLRGIPTFSPRASDAVMQRLCAALANVLHPLTSRERQVLALLTERNSDKLIAEKLGIRHSTVHVHLARLYRKLGVHDREGAVRKLAGLHEGRSSSNILHAPVVADSQMNRESTAD